MVRALLWVLLLSGVILLSWKRFSYSEEKIAGVNLVAPRNPVGEDSFISLEEIQANWVAVIPYGFLDPEDGMVRYSYDWQWWGEGVAGASKTIQIAKDLGYKIMLKPHIWVRGQGWAGDFVPSTDEQWKKWETSYEEYIEAFSKVADSLNVEMFCIGTEMRKVAVEKPEYWRALIKKVKRIYNGQTVYAANWDNYQNLVFWDELDLIGIDAYFPLSNEKTPSATSIAAGWERITQDIEQVAAKFNKPVIFTEYGYRSIDYTADGHWKYDQDTLKTNFTAQMNAYKGLYNAVWQKPWFHGGFLWKWYLETYRNPDRLSKMFTPQQKPVIEVIQEQYK